MNIKGHAVIELKDVETGEIQRIEHDNMLTNGLKYCLTPWLGKFSYATGGSTPQIMTDEATATRKSSNRSIMNHLLGGIFLFQNNLEENADNTAFPLDNPLTGKASWDAYNGADTYRGSYNENESGLQDDGSYKHVWDFVTSQANGQISALALTTYKGGICGCGYKEWSNTETNIIEEPYFNLGHIKINQKGEGGYCSPFINLSSNDIYYVADPYCLLHNKDHADRYFGNTGKLFLKKRKFPLNRISPFYDYYNQYHTEDIEVEVPEEFVSYADHGGNTNIEFQGKISDSYLYVYRYRNKNGATSIKTGETFKVMRIKKSDLSVDVITLTNNTPYYISTDLNFTDDFCFMVTYMESPSRIYRINISDNEITEIKEGIGGLRKIGDYFYAYGSSKYSYCVNPETMEIKFHPLFDIVVQGWWYASTEKIAPNIYLQFQHYNYRAPSEYDIASVYISANTLMTINNLPSPVVKTAAQTMKVTYTIQETE